MSCATVTVVPFARIREIVGSVALERALGEGGTAGDLWEALAGEFPALRELAPSTRLVRNGRFIGRDELLAHGDEVGLLPPFGGG